MTQRCAVHPGRPGADTCPVCARPRCRADATSYAARGCGVCVRSVVRPAPTLPVLERLVRAGLAAHVAALLGGVVASEYVEAPYFSYVAPMLVGLLVAAAATRAARTDGSGVLGSRVRWMAVGYSVLGCGVGFLAQPGRSSAVTELGDKALPYLCAAAGALLWCLPPRAPRAAPTPGPSSAVDAGEVE